MPTLLDQKLALAMLTKKVIRISKDAALWETEGERMNTSRHKGSAAERVRE